MFKVIVILLSSAVVLSVGFNNCAPVHESFTESSVNTACLVALKLAFSDGYHSFLQDNCASCHSTSGIASGYAFADGSIDLAYDAFRARGYTRVGQQAVSAGHQPPFTGSQHQGDINVLSAQWEQDLADYEDCLSEE